MWDLENGLFAENPFVCLISSLTQENANLLELCRMMEFLSAGGFCDGTEQFHIVYWV